MNSVGDKPVVHLIGGGVCGQIAWALCYRKLDARVGLFIKKLIFGTW